MIRWPWPPFGTVYGLAVQGKLWWQLANFNCEGIVRGAISRQNSIYAVLLPFKNHVEPISACNLDYLEACLCLIKHYRMTKNHAKCRAYDVYSRPLFLPFLRFAYTRRGKFFFHPWYVCSQKKYFHEYGRATNNVNVIRSIVREEHSVVF